MSPHLVNCQLKQRRTTGSFGACKALRPYPVPYGYLEGTDGDRATVPSGPVLSATPHLVVVRRAGVFHRVAMRALGRPRFAGTGPTDQTPSALCVTVPYTAPVVCRIEPQRQDLEPGTVVQSILTGVPYFGPPDTFEAECVRAVFITQRNGIASSRCSTTYLARGTLCRKYLPLTSSVSSARAVPANDRPPTGRQWAAPGAMRRQELADKNVRGGELAASVP